MDQVTVTARQRSESIEEVPIAISAFTRSDIERANIKRPADFIQLTPNAALVEAQSAGTSFLTVRGITQVRNGEPPVATVVDGILQVSPNQFNQELIDVEQIEVLKGPQGALYGRNAIGGAINIVTREPTEELSGMVRVGAGNGGLISGGASLSGPWTDDGRARFRVSALYRDFDGLIPNVFLGGKVDYTRDYGARVRNVWDISDALRLELIANASRTDGSALAYVFQPVYQVNDADVADLPHDNNNRGENSRDLDQLAARFDFNTELGTWSGFIARDWIEEYAAGDQFPYTRAISANSPLGFGDGTQTQFLDVGATSAELRLTSPDEQRLRWIAGAYFVQTDRYISTTTGTDLGLGMVRIEHRPAPNDPINPTATFLADDNDNFAYSGFGQINYDLTDELELGVAARYDHDRREQTNRSTVQFDPRTGEQREATFSAWQPKATLTWKPSANLSLFGSYSEGFRSGGFNQSGVGAAAVAIGLNGVSDKFDGETSRAIELGIKSWLWDNRVSLDASVFHTRVEDQQYFSFVGEIGAQILTNIDEVTLRGAELATQWRVTDALSAWTAYGYTDSEIDAYALLPAARGARAPYVPRYTLSSGANYDFNLTDALLGFVRVEYERRGDQFWDPLNTSARSPVELFDLGLGIQAADARWSLEFWGRNLGDRAYNGEWVLGGFAFRAQPRTYGVNFSYNFGAQQ
jgi:iron complex outermembrane receptor protein